MVAEEAAVVAEVAVEEAAVVAAEVAAEAVVVVAEEEDSRNQSQLRLALEETGMGDSKAILRPFSMATTAKATNS